jgi:stage III sporulation protein SpoIIIAA
MAFHQKNVLYSAKVQAKGAGVQRLCKRQQAERALKDLPEIRSNIQRVILHRVGKKELLIAPDGLTTNKLEMCMRKAARLSIHQVDSST